MIDFQMMNQFRYFLPSILTGIMVGTSYIPFPPWALVFCLVPLWARWLDSTSLKEIFWTGWTAQFVFTLIGFYWIAFTSHEFGHLPWPIAGLTLIAFAGLANIYLPIAGLIWGYWKSKTNPSLAVAISALVLIVASLEQAFPMIFPWNFGYPWMLMPGTIRQTAEFIGFDGLSLLTLLINGSLLFAARSSSSTTKAKVLALLLIFGVTFEIWGRALLNKISYGTETLRVVQIQANIGNHEKYMAEKGYGFEEYIRNQYFQQTREFLKSLEPSIAPRIDLILWPEAAIPDFLDRNFTGREGRKKITAFVSEIGVPLLTGGFSRTTTGIYNALFLFDGSGLAIDGPYHKMLLLAFGEYFPGAQWLPFLRKLVPAVSNFQRGSTLATRTLGSTVLGLQVCYESLHPELVRQLVDLKSQIIVNATNDSWFGQTSEPMQHLIMTAGRAIEFRRPLIRTTNTGYSTVILPDGSFLKLSTLHSPWSGLQEVPFDQTPAMTFYHRWGGYLKWLLMGALAMVLALPFVRTRVASQSPQN